MLIAFEGIEGCGKSTQIERVAAWLQGRIRCPVLVTREPGGTPLGSQLRQLLLHSPGPVDPRAELLLYAADRAQHVDQVIKPALDQGYWVLCDRFTDSTLAYQGYGRGLGLALIRQLNTIATAGLVPDLTIWLRLDAATGLARAKQRSQGDRIEQAELAFHQRVQAGFEAIAQQYPEGRLVVDASMDADTITSAICAALQGFAASLKR